MPCGLSRRPLTPQSVPVVSGRAHVTNLKSCTDGKKEGKEATVLISSLFETKYGRREDPLACHVRKLSLSNIDENGCEMVVARFLDPMNF